jgi:hypothetical protein
MKKSDTSALTIIVDKQRTAGDTEEPVLESMKALRSRLERARELAEAARQLDLPPQYEAGNPVHCRGEALSPPIYWQGRQWAVTPFGVECREGTYVIANDRLWENEERYGWVRHMAGKTWTDLPDARQLRRHLPRSGARRADMRRCTENLRRKLSDHVTA